MHGHGSQEHAARHGPRAPRHAGAGRPPRPGLHGPADPGRLPAPPPGHAQLRAGGGGATLPLRRAARDASRRHARAASSRTTMSDSSGRKPDHLAKLRHDLRTPVNQILGYSELLQEEAEEKGQASFVARPRARSRRRRARCSSVVDKALARAAARPRRRRGRRAARRRPSAAREVPPSSARRTRLRHVARDAVSRTRPPPGPAGVLGARAGGGRQRDEPRHVVAAPQAGRGYRVTVAQDGREALRLLDEDRFDAVLLDVMMPDLSGIEVLTPPPAAPLAVRPARDHGHRQGHERGRGRGAAPGRQRLRHEAARLPGGAGPPRDPARAEAAEGRDRPAGRRPRAPESLHPEHLRPLPERGRGEEPARVARGPEARRRAAAGDHPHVRPARLHVAVGEPGARAGGADPERLPRGDGRGHPAPPGADRRVHRRRGARHLRRPGAAARRRAARGGLRRPHAARGRTR